MHAVRSLMFHPWMNGLKMGDTTVYSAIRFACDSPVFVLPAILFFFDGSAKATLFYIGSLQTPK